MSSSGILFTTESGLAAGQRVELSVSWPARLNDIVPLQLVTVGRLVRVEGSQAAIAIERWEFKTCRSTVGPIQSIERGQFRVSKSNANER